MIFCVCLCKTVLCLFYYWPQLPFFSFFIVNACPWNKHKKKLQLSMLWLRWGVWTSDNVRTALALHFIVISDLMMIIKHRTHPDAHMLSDCKRFAYPIKHTHSERAPLQLWGVFKSCSEAHFASWASHSPALPSASSRLPSRPLALEWTLSTTGSGSIRTRACVGLFNIHCDQLSPFD